MTQIDVLVVGAGPTGLSAAAQLARLGRSVLVVDREDEPGGIPRHSAHQGFGLRDLHRSLTGPAYAARLAERARRSGAELRLSCTVTAAAPGSATITSSAGIEALSPRAVLLATGARERPRSARGIPGDRPAGIFTTGQLQQWVRAGLPVGRRAVVLGAEHVSYSAVLSLRHAGVETAAMVTELPRGQSVRGAATAFRWAWGVALLAGHRVVDLEGRARLRAVIVAPVDGGPTSRIEADVLVTTGDWVPDLELARSAALPMDEGTRGPRTDVHGRSGRPGLYAAGNLVHPVETADRCGLAGRSAARTIDGDLRRSTADAAVALEAGDGLVWAWPNAVDPLRRPAEILLRTSNFSAGRRIVASQAGVVLGEARIRGGTPNRRSWVTGEVLAGAAGGAAVRLDLT